MKVDWIDKNRASLITFRIPSAIPNSKAYPSHYGAGRWRWSLRIYTFRWRVCWTRRCFWCLWSLDWCRNCQTAKLFHVLSCPVARIRHRKCARSYCWLNEKFFLRLRRSRRRHARYLHSVKTSKDTKSSKVPYSIFSIWLRLRYSLVRLFKPLKLL